MPAVGGGGRGNAGRSTRSARKRARRDVSPPPIFRSDAAQRAPNEGRRVAPGARSDAAQKRGARTPTPIGSGHASERGRMLRPKLLKRRLSDKRSDAAQGNSTLEAALRAFGISDAALGNQTSAADAFLRTSAYREALTAARRARIRRAIARHEPITATRAERATRGRAPQISSQDIQKVLARLLQSAYVPTTGGGPSVGVSAGTGFKAPRGAAAALAPKPIQYGQSQTGRNLASDLVTLGTSPFVGGYELGAGTFEAARHGDTSRLERLASETAKQTYETFRHPVKSFGEHPLITPLTFAGAKTLAGRTAGAAARGAGKQGAKGARGALERAGTTVRPPIALVDDPALVRKGHGIEERAYSKDLGRKAIQVAADRKREPLRDADGKIVMVKQRGHMVPALKAGPGAQNRRLKSEADFEASRANALERQVRHEAAREFRVRGIRGRAAQDLVTLAVRGTIRSVKTFAQDAYDARARLMTEHEARLKDAGYRHSGEAEQAARQIKLLDRVVRDKRIHAQAPKIIQAAERIGSRLNERERELLARGVLSDEKRARRAGLIDYAVEHMGARHVTANEHAALERAAANTERTARATYERALNRAKGRQTPAVITARREYDSARRERIRVSGREPEGVKRHDAARERLASAEATEKAAKRRVAAVTAKRDRLTGAQASRRGRRAHEGGLAAATKTEQAKIAKARREVAQAKRELRDATSARRKAAEGARQARLPEQTSALRRGDASFLSTKEIEEHIRGAGRDPESVAYLPYEGAGARAFHTQLRPGTRPVLDKPGTRTGEQYRKGAVETSKDLLVEHGVRQATQLAKAQQLDRLVEGSGIAHPDGGRYWTWKEAEEIHGRVDFDTRTGSPVFLQRNGQKLVPMRAYASRLSEETQRIIRDELQGPGAMETLHLRLLNDRVIHSPEEARGARNVVLVPAAKIERLQQHLRPAGDIQKFFQALNRPFRMAVLPQPRWLAGNFAEPYIVRLTASGSGLNVFGLANDMRAFSKGIRAMERDADPAVRAAAAEIRAQQTGSGLFVGGGQARAVRRGYEDLPESAQRAYGQMVSKLPATKNAVEMLGVGGRFALLPLKAFFALNRVIEQGAQRAAFGHQFRRDLQEFGGSWSQTVRLQEKAVAEAARGLVNTPTQQRFMREQHVLLGKYEGYSPRLRSWIQGPMPFLPWALNAARFVYWTMPAHHTALTALLTQVNDVVAKDWQDIHRDVPPGSLKFALPNGKGGWIDLARYTPWGLFTNGTQTITGEVAPHFQGPIKALEGQDPFGRELVMDPRENTGETQATGGQRKLVAANSLAEALVPYLSTARRLREGGGTAYAGSTVLDPDVKPGTSHMGAARRTFDPLRPTYLGATQGRVSARAPKSADPVDRALDQIGSQAEIDAAQDAAIDEALRRLGR